MHSRLITVCLCCHCVSLKHQNCTRAKSSLLKSIHTVDKNSYWCKKTQRNTASNKSSLKTDYELMSK